jgi:inhibitor of KinA
VHSNAEHTIHPLGNSALVVSFGNRLEENIYRDVLSAYHRLLGEASGIFTDIIPAYSSVSVMYDIKKARALPGDGSVFSQVGSYVESLLSEPNNRNELTQRKLRVPVCYNEKYAPDLAEMVIASGLPQEEIIQIHVSQTYKVYMLGFLPGFPYMGIVNEKIRFPRKKTPRTLVEAGSVGIAGQQTGIYPFDSPGGWQIIGRTPIQLFDASSGQPAYFLPGDEVEFFPISAYEFENY